MPVQVPPPGRVLFAHMLEAFKFAAAAVAKGPRAAAMPTLTHFRIRDGRVTAANGDTLAASVPVPVHVDCLPHAGAFLKALEGCGSESPAFHMDGNLLVIRAGSFQSSVKCGDASRFPEVLPQGQYFPVSQPLLPVLKKLAPFMGTDELRPWSCGVLFSGNTVTATNNIAMVQAWLGVAFDQPIVMPAEAVHELLRLQMEPTHIQVAEDRVTFHLPGDAWISSALMARAWPDLDAVLAQVKDVPVRPLPPGLLDAVERLKKFTGPMGKVYFAPGYLSTLPPGVTGEEGTQVATPDSPGSGVFRLEVLLALRGVAEQVGFDNHPRAVPFYGDNVRGCFLGFTA